MDNFDLFFMTTPAHRNPRRAKALCRFFDENLLHDAVFDAVVCYHDEPTVRCEKFDCALETGFELSEFVVDLDPDRLKDAAKVAHKPRRHGQLFHDFP